MPFRQPRRESESKPSTSTPFLKSVSSVFKKRTAKPVDRAGLGIGWTASGPSHRTLSSTSTGSTTYGEYEDSDEEVQNPDDVEIRRPSGLGRRCSSDGFGSMNNLGISPSTASLPSPTVARFSMPNGVIQFHEDDGEDGVGLGMGRDNPYRGRSESFAQLFGLRIPLHRLRAVSSPQPSPTTADWPLPPPLPIPFPEKVILDGERQFALPAAVVREIVEFLPIQAQPELACVCSTFCTAVQRRLYRSIDVDTCVRPTRLLDVLASKRNLAALVTTFKWERWLDEEDGVEEGGDEELPGSLAISLAVALSRMSNLVSLGLPSFDTQLFGALHNSFHLTSLTLYCTSMSADLQTNLFTWLEGHPTITSLSFPSTRRRSPSNTPLTPLDVTPIHDRQQLSPAQFLSVPGQLLTPSTTPMTPAFPPGITAPPSYTKPGHSSPSPTTLLPNLTSLHAPTSLILLLAPGRPSLKHVTVIIDQSLYNGLRPSGLMSALVGCGLESLFMRFRESVDKRTIEKVLATAGSTLSGDEEGHRLREAGIELNWSVADIEDTVYKIIPSVLPRFRKLRTLRLRAGSGMSARSPLSGAEERGYLQTWFKQCPSLSMVELLDRSQWSLLPGGAWRVHVAGD